MAKVAVSVQDTGHATTATIVAAIQAAGHTATAVADSTLTATSLAAYDVIFCVRAQMTTAMAAIYRGYIAAGKRLYWGFLAGVGAGAGYTGGAAVLKMCASENLISGQTPFSFSIGEKAAVFYRMGQAESLHTAGNLFFETFASPAADAAVLATADSDASRIAAFIYPPGAKDTAGVAFGAACGCIGFLYSTTAFTARGIAAIKALIEFDPVSISGVVRDAADIPVQRRVRVYDRASGVLMAGLLSDAATGAYRVALNAGIEVNVACLDDDTGDVLSDLITRTTTA